MKVPDLFPVTLKPYNQHASDHSLHLPCFLKGTGLLFRNDLLEAMRSFGVGNLQTFNVALFDPDNGHAYTNDKAANIVGSIAAADMTQSIATVHPGGPVIDVDFDKLVVDESKARGALIFRLAEATNASLVHERLRGFLLARGFDDLDFYDPKEVAL